MRRLVAPAALLDLWAEEGAEPQVRLSERLPAGQTRRGARGHGLAAALGLAGLDHGVTGIAAALLMRTDPDGRACHTGAGHRFGAACSLSSRRSMPGRLTKASTCR